MTAHRVARPRTSSAAVAVAFNAGGAPTDPDPPAVHRLREYSNSLAPRLGALSADTWTLFGIYLRGTGTEAAADREGIIRAIGARRRRRRDALIAS